MQRCCKLLTELPLCSAVVAMKAADGTLLSGSFAIFGGFLTGALQPE